MARRGGEPHWALRAQSGCRHDRGRHAACRRHSAGPRRHRHGRPAALRPHCRCPQKPNIALIYTPAEGVRDAVAECAQVRIETIMAVAEYVPVHDALAAANVARAAGSWLIGPNTLGIYVPG